MKARRRDLSHLFGQNLPGFGGQLSGLLALLYKKVLAPRLAFLARKRHGSHYSAFQQSFYGRMGWILP